MGADIRAVAAEVADRLRRRGIPLSGDERPEDLADLLAAVERFESAVEARGGDLMVNDLKSSEPDDPHFVVPSRLPEESFRDYSTRIDAATLAVRQHPDISA
jgi:broad specificity phosphatase PhoE